MNYADMNLYQVFERVLENTRNIIITLPKTIDWDNEYSKELETVKDYSQVMNFKVPYLPKGKLDKCYIVHDGKIKGWMKIVGVVDNIEFKCSTTGETWEGKFIQRSGPFHYLENEIPYKGFQGWRYFDENLLNT